MKICHVCKLECDDNVELCPKCGADLTQVEVQDTKEKIKEEILEQEVQEDSEKTDTLVLLATMEDIVSAEIFKDILTDNNISYSCPNQDDETMRVTFGGGFASCEIYVNNDDFDIAENLYKDFLSSESTFDEDLFDESEEFEVNEE